MAEAGDLHVDVTALKEDFARAMQECPRDLFDELKPAGEKFLEQWIARGIKAQRFDRGSSTIKSRTHTLGRSFSQTSVGSDLSTLRYAAGTIHQGLPYAWIQEFGGEVVPKRGRFLTVPLAPALTASGVLRQPARWWPDTFVRIRPGGGGGVIFQKRPGGGLVALFALVKRVRIAGKLGFFDSWKRNQPGFLKHLGEAVARALKRNAERKGGGS